MIDLVLKQLRKITLCLETLFQAPIVLILDPNLSSPRDTDHQIRKAKTIIPQFKPGLARPGDFRIDKRAAEPRRLHPYEDNPFEYSNLRGSYSSSVTGGLAKRRQCVAQIAH